MSLISCSTLSTGIIVTSLVAVCLSGVSAIPSIFVSLMTFSLVTAKLLCSKGNITKVAAYVFLFYSVNMLSMLGTWGAEAILSSPVSWIRGEGRIFIYYWPALSIIFILQDATPNDLNKVRQNLTPAIRSVTLLYAFIMALSHLAWISPFSSHHSAGAIGSTVVLFHAARGVIYRKPADFIFFSTALFATLGSNSRTALISLLISALAFAVIGRKTKLVFSVLCVMVSAVIVMQSAFKSEFYRLHSDLSLETLPGTMNSFAHGLQEIEEFSPQDRRTVSRKAIEQTNIKGDANMLIRGYHWGDAVEAFIKSPLIGIGFGRYNDSQKDYIGIENIIWVSHRAGQVDISEQTAHNFYLNTLAETGLIGLMAFLGIIIHLAKPIANHRENQADALFSRTIGLITLIYLILSGLTNHSFGAPAYGFTLLPFVAFAYSYMTALSRPLN